MKAQFLVLRPYTSQGLRLAHTEIYNRQETATAIAEWVREQVSHGARTGVFA